MLAEKLLPVVKSLPSDPYFYDVSLLLTGDGTNGAQNNTFLDSSTNNFTITRNGNTTQGTFSPYGNLWSNYFDGTNDYLTVPSNAAFDIGSGAMTIEAWVYPTASATSVIVTRAPNGSTYPTWELDLIGLQPQAYFSSTGSSYALYILSSTNVVLNTWNHIAVARSGSSFRMWLNGVSVGTGTNSSSMVANGSAVGIGCYPDGTSDFPGYISNVRVVKGTAVYDPSQSTITVPTTPLTAVSGTSLLTCQSNRFIDNSSNNFTITRNGDTSVQRFSPFNPTAPYSTSVIGGSGYFDGNEDYLTVANNAAFNFGSGNFTVEFWINSPSIPDLALGVVGAWPTSGNTGWLAYIDSTSFVFYINGANTNLTISNNFQFNVWNHYAVVRNGNTWTVYLNGTSIGSITSSTAIADTAAALNIGINGSNNRNDVLGYISDVRIVKGTAVYNANFTPPTSPLTAITNTSLLCNMTNAGIPDAAMMNDLQTVGNAQVSTSVKKYGTGSLAFDGTGDYLDLSNNPIYAFGTGDFTLEMWLYHTSNSAQRIIGNYVSSGNTEFDIEFAANGTIYFGSYSTYTQTSTAVSLNTWTHIAWVRSSGVETFYINGVSAGSATRSLNFSSTTGPRIGGSKDLTTNLYVGYIDDLRITKGYARYTANFTPPTAALPTY